MKGIETTLCVGVGGGCAYEVIGLLEMENYPLYLFFTP